MLVLSISRSVCEDRVGGGEMELVATGGGRIGSGSVVQGPF
jgi:hypothetical protein